MKGIEPPSKGLEAFILAVRRHSQSLCSYGLKPGYGFRANDESRTHSLFFRRELLYPLSYIGLELC